MVRPLAPGGTATQEFPPRAAEWHRLRSVNFSVSTLSDLYIENRKRGGFFLYIFVEQFLAFTASPVPKQARLLTKSSSHSEKFIEASRELANYLFEQHTGATSPSLLCVMDAASGAG